MSSTNRHSGSVAFFSNVFCFFLHLIAVARIPSTMLSESGESWFSASLLRQRVTPVQATCCPSVRKGRWAHGDGDEDSSLTNHPSATWVSPARGGTSHRDLKKSSGQVTYCGGASFAGDPSKPGVSQWGTGSQVQQGRRTVPWAPMVCGARVWFGFTQGCRRDSCCITGQIRLGNLRCLVSFWR